MLKTVMMILAAALVSAEGTVGRASAATLTLGAGDILVADVTARDIIRVDPTTGAQTTVSSGGSLTKPIGIAIAANSDLFITNAGGSGPGSITRVDPATGAQTTVSSGGNLRNPIDLAIAVNGDLFVGDLDGGIIRVNPSTGAQTLIRGPRGPTGIAVAANGDLLVAEERSAISRVDPTTGATTTISSGGSLSLPTGIAIAANGDLLVTDRGTASIIRVNPSTGAQTTVSSGGGFGSPNGIAIAANGDLLVVDPAFASVVDPAFACCGGVIRVDPITGAQTAVSLGGVFVGPIGIAIVGPQQPAITNVSPNSGPPGLIVTMTGSHFGNTQASGFVRFDSNIAGIVTWADTQIQTVVPNVPALNLSYEATVTTGDGVSNGIPFLVTSPSNGGGAIPPGQSGQRPSPGPANRRLVLVGESANDFRVLQFHDVTVGSTSDTITSDVTIQNNWDAWYILSIVPVGNVGNGLPARFPLGPSAKKTFRLKFKRGESILFFANGALGTDPRTIEDFQLLAIYGAEILWRAFFGSPMPQGLADFALSVAAQTHPLVGMALCARNLDVPCTLRQVERITGDPFLSTELTALGIPIVERVSILQQALRLFRVLEFLAEEYTAAALFPFDSLTIKAF